MNNFDISIRQQKDFFGFRFSGYINITRAGEYEFFLKSNDGSKLFINGEELIDNDGTHSTRELKKKIDLTQFFDTLEYDDELVDKLENWSEFEKSLLKKKLR